jgi:hypothetical protein
VGKHQSEIEQDGKQEGRPIPPPQKDSGSGGGKHQKGK